MFLISFNLSPDSGKRLLQRLAESRGAADAQRSYKELCPWPVILTRRWELCYLPSPSVTSLWISSRILNTTLFESWELIGPYPSWWLFNGLLVTLQILHIIWSYLIIRTAYKALVRGKVRGWLLLWVLCPRALRPLSEGWCWLSRDVLRAGLALPWLLCSGELPGHTGQGRFPLRCSWGK